MEQLWLEVLPATNKDSYRCQWTFCRGHSFSQSQRCR